MRSTRRTPRVVIALTLTLTIVAAACAPPPAPPTDTWRFRANQVTAVVGNDPFIKPPLIGCTSEGYLSNCYDEAYTINIWFRVKFGVPNSAQTGVVSSRSHAVSLCAQNRTSCSGRPTTRSLNEAQGGQVTFNDVTRVDIVDLLVNPDAPVEIIGTWTWAMEEDLAGTLNAGPIATILRNVLNDTIAVGTIPDDLGNLVQLIIDNLGQAILLGGSLLLNAITSVLFGMGDDVLGSRIYVGVAARGSLGEIIDATVPDLGNFNTNLSFVGIPNVLGISVRSLRQPQAFNGQVFNQDGRHDYNFLLSP
jgi:hypothetical protein